jgi:hypothetical protein
MMLRKIVWGSHGFCLPLKFQVEGVQGLGAFPGWDFQPVPAVVRLRRNLVQSIPAAEKMLKSSQVLVIGSYRSYPVAYLMCV